MTTIPSQSALIQSYSDQLSSRFHSNSMACEVLMCLVVIVLLVVQILKVMKKSYEWLAEFEISLSQRYVDDSKIGMRESQLQEIDNQNDCKPPKSTMQRQIPAERPAVQIKKQTIIPPIIQVEEILKRMIPQLAIIAINIVMLSAYEFVTISAYIVIVLVAISEILGLKETEHLNLKFILEIITKLLMIGWYINVLAVAKPSPY